MRRHDDRAVAIVDGFHAHEATPFAVAQISDGIAGINRVHPHKFRRTLATHAIDKGMPIEQVQKLLGHARIDTTMHYVMVNQNNVKASHRRYLE